MRTTLGIDLGTSGVRAVVLGQDGALATRTGRLDPPARCDPAALWASVAAALDQLDLSRVAAVAIAGTSGSILPIAVDSAPVGPLSLYNASASRSLQQVVARSAPTGSAALGSTSPLARAIGLLTMPGACRILHEADWVAGHLCGRFDATDENNALKTGYDPIERMWPAWVAATGIRIDQLPRVLPPGTPIANVSAAAADRFGLPHDALVAAGTTDGCASFLATGAAETGDAVTALGSTTTLKLLAAGPVFASADGVYSHRLLGQWLAGGASNAGGAVLARYFAPDQIRALSKRIDPSTPSPCDFYPLPEPGERFPVNDPALMPRLTPRPSDDSAFLHGLLEGIARIEAMGYQRLVKLGAPAIKRVLTTGGGAGNPVWTAIRARVLGVPVHAAAVTEAAHGAAILARSALTEA